MFEIKTRRRQPQQWNPSAIGFRNSLRGRLRRIQAIAFALAIGATMTSLPEARAQNMIFATGLEGGPITDAEWKLLPEYCIDTQGFKYGKNGSPNTAKWVALLGETFWALHHYCLGIVKFNRSQKFGIPGVIQRGFLSSALGEFTYVVEHMPENYILAPEILTYVGRTHLLLNEPKLADAAFARARQMKPDYWPAYSWWASYLAAHGEPDKARTIAQEGLVNSPNSRTLQLILADLDSKKGPIKSQQPGGRDK